MSKLVLVLPVCLLACDAVLPISGQDAAEAEQIGQAVLIFLQQAGHSNANKLFNVRPGRSKIVIRVFLKLSPIEVDRLKAVVKNIKDENKINKDIVVEIVS